MDRRNAGSPPAHMSKPDRGPGMPALGISLGLHGAALACFVLFWEATPPQPHAVISVELVREVVGHAGKAPGEQPPLSQAPETAPATGSPSDMRSLADNGARNERPAAFDPPGESDGSAVVRGGDPTPVSGPAPGNGSDRHESVPPVPIGAVFAADKASAVEASTEVTLRIPPPPPSKPLPPKSSESRGGSADLTMALDGDPTAVSRQAPTPRDGPKSHATVPPTPSKPVFAADKAPVAEASAEVALRIPPPSESLPPGSSTGRTSAKILVMAALPASVRRGAIVGSLDGTPESRPSYAGSGLSNAPPRYPYLARRWGQEGRVVLRVRVNAGGDPTAVRVRQSSGYRLLDDAAVAAVETWRFVPANRGGIPVTGAVDVPVSFKFTN